MQPLGSGDVVGNRFEIDRAAGSGGMGTVYRARDLDSGALVALKLIHVGGVGESARFVREAQLLSELRHPGIVAYVAHGQAKDGQLYLAMEWLEGEDLGQRLNRGPLSLGQSLALMTRIAEALELAHRQGIVHRDLKPTNLFLVGGEVERVKILDFGIARRQGSMQAMTQTGMIVGTPEYMAPEQARGSRELTPAADMFSLGCVLYECLCGEPPFVGEHIAAVLMRILFEQPEPIHVRHPEMPKSIAVLIDDLLQKDVALRIADATALLKHLMQLGETCDRTFAENQTLVADFSPSFAESEQVLCSLVVASGSQREASLAATMSAAYERPEKADHDGLLSAVRSLGAAADYLLHGPLVATMPQTGSAQDQATMAARVALLIKNRWPEATVVVTTGRGRAHGLTAVGEVADRAVKLLEQRSGVYAAVHGPTSGVWLDELSLRLLGPSFIVTQAADGALLIAEERETDGSRLLLGKPTPCVGRDVELGVLSGLLAGCIDEAEPRIGLITAQPGDGKSRLRHEFLRRVEARSEPVTVLSGRGDVLSAGAPYAILSAAIRKRCGIAGSEPPEMQQAHLRSRLAPHLAPDKKELLIPFIGELCGIPFSASGIPALQAARNDPKIMYDAVRTAFIDWLRAECAAAPLLLLLDDFQWSDALTVSVIDEALYELRSTAFCVVALARPEVHKNFPRLWQRHNVQELLLRPLSKKACTLLILQVLGKNVAPQALERAIAQSAGNALFLEEQIRAIAEGKSEDGADTVIAMLQARIGRLDAGPRKLIRAAAVFGQTFWRGGVANLLGMSATSSELGDWLSTLVSAEMIQTCPKSRLGNEDEYVFRHALVRDAAYGLLSDSDVRIGHRKAGEFLEAAGEHDAFTIAEHFERGAAPERAIKYLIMASDWAAANKDLDSVLKWTARGIACGASGEDLGILRSLQTAAHTWQDAWQEACACGIEAVSLLPHGGLRWCKLMPPLLLASSGAQPQVFGGLVGQFAMIPTQAEARVAYVEAASWLVVLLSCTGQRTAAQGFLELLNTISQSLNTSEAAAWGQVWIGQVAYARMLGRDPWANLITSQNGLAYAERAQDWRNAVVLQTWLGCAQQELGDLQSAEQTLREAEKVAKRIREPFALGVAACYLSWHFSLLSDSESLRQSVQLARSALASQQVNPFVVGLLNCALAHALLKLDELDSAVVAARAACELLVISWPLRIRASAVYTQVMSRRGWIAEAQAFAKKELAELNEAGGGGYAEVALLCALAEAQQTAADVAAAQSTVVQALQLMKLRADQIPDSAVRERYLTKVPENIRLRELAALLGCAEEGIRTPRR